MTEPDWSIDVDPEQLVANDSPVMQLVRSAATVPGSPLASWTEKEFTQLAIELLKASLSQFMHGEQGAMLTAAKIVETVPWIDAKYYAATQTMDEARHTEVFARYLYTKVGDAYPMGPVLEAQITSLLEDCGGTSPTSACRSSSRAWPSPRSATCCGARRAAAAQAAALRAGRRGPPRGVRDRHARRVLPGPVVGRAGGRATGVPARELHTSGRGRSTPTCGSAWARRSTRCGRRQGGQGEDAIPTLDRIVRAWLLRQARAQRPQLGLLDANDGYLRRRWAEAGLLQFEFADDTASDYEPRRCRPGSRALTRSLQRIVAARASTSPALGADLRAGHRPVGGDDGEGVGGGDSVEHQDAHGHRTGPPDAGAAVDEEMLAVAEARRRRRGTAGPRRGAGRGGPGSGTRSAPPVVLFTHSTYPG